MRGSGQKFSRSQRFVVSLAVVFMLWIGGCGDFITGKTAGRESNSILDELSKIEPIPEANIPMPSIYKGPPKIVELTVGGVTEYRLLYFCRHHNAEQLKQIIQTQFGSVLFDVKGKSTRVPDYTVSSIPSTNQLIVRTPDRDGVESVLEFLEHVDVPPIQVKIDCLISEIYADKTLDWETTLQIENLIGENIWAGPAGRPFGEAVMQLVEDSETIAAFPGASLRELARARMGLKVGYLSKDHKFLSLVDLLESQGYLKILMNPTLEVINGQMAKISSSQRVPVDKTYLHSAQSEFFTTKTEWADVVDSLQITPHVFADGYIGLETSIELGSKLTPEGIKQVSIVTKKQIQNKENRIRPGESLIIGGLRKSERRDVVRGIPLLKDIPLVGILFSGRDFEERAVETIFILTPTISSGGIPNKEMMEEVERRQDPGGRQEKFQEAEQARLEAEAEKAEARAATREAEEQAKKAEAEAQKAIEETEKATAAQQQAKTEVEKAQADVKTAAEKAAAAAQQAQAQIAKITAESEKLKAEAEKAKAEAQKAAAELELAKAAAQKATAEADKAKADAQKAEAEAEKAKADTAKTTAEAEKAKADADKAKADATTAKAEAEQLTEKTTKAKAEAQKAIADAVAKTKAAEKAKAEAEAEKAAAQKIKSEAEKAKAEADAKAKAEAEQTKAESPKRKGEADKNNSETEKPKTRSKKRKETVAKKNRDKKNKANTERRKGKKQKQPKQQSKRTKRR
jgi:hypothetical protein